MHSGIILSLSVLSAESFWILIIILYNLAGAGSCIFICINIKCSKFFHINSKQCKQCKQCEQWKIENIKSLSDLFIWVWAILRRCWLALLLCKELFLVLHLVAIKVKKLISFNSCSWSKLLFWFKIYLPAWVPSFRTQFYLTRKVTSSLL